jgi:hypothetical protein
MSLDTYASVISNTWRGMRGASVGARAQSVRARRPHLENICPCVTVRQRNNALRQQRLQHASKCHNVSRSLSEVAGGAVCNVQPSCCAAAACPSQWQHQYAAGWLCAWEKDICCDASATIHTCSSRVLDETWSPRASSIRKHGVSCVKTRRKQLWRGHCAVLRASQVEHHRLTLGGAHQTKPQCQGQVGRGCQQLRPTLHVQEQAAVAAAER